MRQSTQQQIIEHRESTARQYALVDRAVAFGWTRDRVEVIDEDLGQSGASSQTRSGFQRLLAEISNDSVGMVLGLEMSRLSRSGKDWHALLPRTISFKGTLQTLEAFQPMLAIRGESSRLWRQRLYEQLLEAIVTHRVGDCPGRIEPRRTKRRHKHNVPLSVPRAEAKRQIMEGLSKN